MISVELIKDIDRIINDAYDNGYNYASTVFFDGRFSNKDTQLMAEKCFPNYRFIWEDSYDNCGISRATYLKIIW